MTAFWYTEIAQLYEKVIPFLVFLFRGLSCNGATNKVYWVGPETGGALNSSNWATTSGGAAGAYPPNVDYQLIFDGGGTTGKTYTINVNTTTGGYIVVANNTTVILQRNANGSSVMIGNSGYNVQAGSKLVLENTGTGSLYFTIFGNAPSYNGNVSGEMVMKSPVLNCTQSSCAEVWLNLSGLITVSGTKVLTVTGTLRMDGTKSMIHTSNNGSLVFAANSNLVLNTAAVESLGAFDANSTTTITGVGLGDPRYLPPYYLGTNSVGNLIYDCPLQTTDCTLFYNAGAWTVKGNFTVKNTGTGNLILSNGTVEKDFILQGSVKPLVGNFTVNGNVAIQDGQPLDLNGTLTVKGNVNNGGVIKVSTTGITKSKIAFTGTAQQTFVPGTVSNDAVSFEVNNSAGIAVNSNWALPSNTNAKLILTNGNISMGANVLTVQNPSPGAVVGGTAASHIIGKLRRVTNTAGGSYVFPVSASATESANIKLSPFSSDLTNYEISFFRPSPYSQTAVPAGIRNAANYYWDISRVSGGANADVTFVYGANNFAAQNPNAQSDLRVLHWNGSSWDNLGGFGVSGEITAGNVSAFSPFTLGTAGMFALPVQLVSFVGARQGNSNLLKWTVAQEKDVRLYEVERSADSRVFTSHGTVTAVNGSADYSYTDYQPLSLINFYRLKIVDNNGRFSYTQTLSIKMDGQRKLDVYPNPAFSRIFVQYMSTGGPMLIRDANGRTVKAVAVGQMGVVSTTVDISTLPKGMYFISTGKEVASFLKE